MFRIDSLEVPAADTDVALAADWPDDAACRGQTPLFFAKKAERPEARLRREERARKLCSSCPVQPQCLQFGRANREFGVWGGESEEQRHLAGFTLTVPIGVRAREMDRQRARDRSSERAGVELFEDLGGSAADGREVG